MSLPSSVSTGADDTDGVPADGRDLVDLYLRAEKEEAAESLQALTRASCEQVVEVGMRQDKALEILHERVQALEMELESSQRSLSEQFGSICRRLDGMSYDCSSQPILNI